MLPSGNQITSEPTTAVLSDAILVGQAVYLHRPVNAEVFTTTILDQATVMRYNSLHVMR